MDPTGCYLIDYFEVELSTGQVEDLLRELDWWLALLEHPENVIRFLDFSGAATEVLVAMKLVGASWGIPAGVALLYGGTALDYTLDDLKTLRYELAMAAGRTKTGGYTTCAKGVSLRMGYDMLRWGIEVNGNEVVSHLHGVAPWLPLKGNWNLTRQFLITWYLFDYERGPFASFGPLSRHYED